ncbi:MAG: helix-turn-helix domain-containing protein [Vicinamibacteria bacterium]
MKKARKSKAPEEEKRDLFSEIMEGFAALKEAREGKRTLRTHRVKLAPPVTITPKQIIQLRESRNLSRGVFARYLRTNVRTLENWEQGRARPNAQAALLISLVKRYPDTVDRLATI